MTPDGSCVAALAKAGRWCGRIVAALSRLAKRVAAPGAGPKLISG